MKKSYKTLIALCCVLALMAGSAAVSSVITAKRQNARPIDVQLMVAGQPCMPTDDAGNKMRPILQDGTVYLPLWAIGDAFGKSVEWDEAAGTVRIGKAPLVEDAQQLVDILEETHPAFALDAVPEGYEAAKAALLEQAAEPDCTLADFVWAAMAYTASMQDEHTRIDPFGGVPQPVLDVNWVADGAHLYLTDEAGNVTATEVTGVGGLSTAELFAAIDLYVASENKAGQDLNHTLWAASPSLLMQAGAAIADDYTLELMLQDAGNTSTRTVGLVDAEAVQEPVITTQMIGDVFYADFNMCEDGPELQSAVAALRQAVASGTSKVIIDVRGNGGGNSDTCVQLLNAMGMEAPEYGAYVRYSPLAMGTYPDSYDKDAGGDLYAPVPETAKANPDVRLVVLTDEVTFSSATMMGVYVRDGGLGTLIGRPSSNAPNSYGDILMFSLNNNGLFCTVSHKQFLRPDQSAQGNELTPDILTAVGEDALQTALSFLAEQE